MSRFRIPLSPIARVRCIASVMLLFLLAAGLPAMPPTSALAQAHPNEYNVEAADLFNFGKFMHLSTGSHALRGPSFDICILGSDPIRGTIGNLAAHKKIDGRPVRVIGVSDATQARTCDIVFIGAQENDSFSQALAILAGSDVLTVGNSPEFLKDGGMIQFLEQARQVRFAVNLDVVRKTHLVLSSQLLRVAKFVMGGPQPEGAP